MTPPTSTPSILLADDDEQSRNVLTSFFKIAGWHYDAVSDGASALRAASERDYDVIVTDLVMPDTTGVLFLKNLRQARPTQAVIGVAGKTVSVHDAIEFLKEGASDFLVKPVDFDVLERAVQRAMNGIRRERFDGNLYTHVLAEECVLAFRTHEIANGRLSLNVIEKLHSAGVIDSGMKLKLVLAFQEALTNSIDHGNLELDSAWKEMSNDEGMDEYSRQRRDRLKDPHYADRTVTVSWSYMPGRLQIGIKDEGKGFLQNESESNLDETKTEVCHGRGLIILSSLLDEVLYSEGGTQVALVKYLVTPGDIADGSTGGSNGT